MGTTEQRPNSSLNTIIEYNYNTIIEYNCNTIIIPCYTYVIYNDTVIGSFSATKLPIPVQVKVQVFC